MRIDIEPGAILVSKDKLVHVLALTAVGRIRLRDLATGEVFETDAGDLKARPPISPNAQTPPVNLLAASAKDWAIAQQRATVLDPLLHLTGDIKTQVQRAAAGLRVSSRTVYRLLMRYRSAPLVSTLLPERGGNKEGNRRVPAQVDAIITEVIEVLFLTRERPRYEDVYREVDRRCQQTKLSSPARNTVIARIKAMDPIEVTRKRFGAKVARAKRPAPGRFDITVPLDVVQIDHTLVDVILVDDAYRRPIGRPWISLAIDLATRSVLGFYLTLDPPSSTSVALCLAQATLPKDDWLCSRDLELEWPMWGLPRYLHLDNAKEFKSQVLQRGCSEYGIHIDYRPPGCPHFGGHIERLIGTLMGRVHLLPGTTQSNQ